MNTDELLEHVDAAKALLTHDAIEARIRGFNRSAKSKAYQTLKTGQYVRPTEEHGSVRITAGGAVYRADPKTGAWRRIKGDAATQIKRMFQTK